MTQNDVEAFSPRTFAQTYVQPGDILYLPPGSLTCEKAVTQHNLLLRACSTLISVDCVQSCLLVAGASGVRILDWTELV